MLEKIKELETTLEKKTQTIKIYETQIQELEKQLRESQTQSQSKKIQTKEPTPESAELLEARNTNNKLNQQIEILNKKLIETEQKLDKIEKEVFFSTFQFISSSLFSFKLETQNFNLIFILLT
jgi:chromosome segregation ATPase